MSRTALILGAGVGGLVAAHRLRRRLPRDYRVVLIDRSPRHVFQPSLLWVADGSRDPGRIGRPIERLRGKGIEVIVGDIEAIDPDRCSVRVRGDVHRGDAMIIALGAELAPELIPGLAEAGHNLYTLDGARRIRETLARRWSGRLVVLTAAPAYKCPAAPYEAAMLLEAVLRRQGSQTESVVEMFAAEPGPMGVAGPNVSAGVRALLESRGIAYYPNRQVTTVHAAERRIAFSDGSTADFDLLVYVPPHRAPAVVRDSGLVADSGWMAVDRRTLQTKFASVFAIGDVTSVPLAMGKPLPKAGVFAHGQAEVVAENLAADWTGTGKHMQFDGHGSCFVEIGDGRAAYGAGDFYAEPLPQVFLKPPARRWHWGKVLLERYFLSRWF
jgi:sulfide:quinone oxidoreductase